MASPQPGDSVGRFTVLRYVGDFPSDATPTVPALVVRDGRTGEQVVMSVRQWIRWSATKRAS